MKANTDYNPPFFTIHDTERGVFTTYRTLKECVKVLKSAENGFYDVISPRGVIHCYMKSGWNLWEDKKSGASLVK
jgi:hypothetical protein